MKIFKIKTEGEFDWVLAEDFLSCLKYYLNEVGVNVYELDTMEEVPQSEWDTNKIRFDDETENGTFYMTYSEYVKGIVEPMIICSTAY